MVLARGPQVTRRADTRARACARVSGLLRHTAVPPTHRTGAVSAGRNAAAIPPARAGTPQRTPGPASRAHACRRRGTHGLARARVSTPRDTWPRARTRVDAAGHMASRAHACRRRGTYGLGARGRPSRLRGLEILEHGGDALPAADAHRLEAVAATAPAQLAQQRREDPGSGAPMGAQRDAGAAHVDALDPSGSSHWRSTASA